jgi:polar amino acid transport system substrate-binding protein
MPLMTTVTPTTGPHLMPRTARMAPAFLFFACFLAQLAVAAEKSVRLATHDQPPYGTYQTDKTFDGVAVRVMKCVFKRLDRPLVIEVYPWERAQKMVEWNEIDGFFPATYKKERLEWSSATDIIADQKWVWYMPADSKLDPASADFKANARVGAHFGSNRLKTLIEEGYQVVIQPPTDGYLLTALLNQRADAILGGNLAIDEAMKAQGIDPARLRSVVMRDNPLLAYFGRKFIEREGPEFIKRFNAQIPKCR